MREVLYQVKMIQVIHYQGNGKTTRVFGYIVENNNAKNYLFICEGLL